MQKYIDRGHVEKVPTSDKGAVGFVNYLPVVVVPEPKKQKVRIAYDSSASFNQSSLNDSLLRGPDVANRLCVLLRFRLKKVGFAADVKCMFHAFHVPPEHRDEMRFFWWANNKVSETLSVYRAEPASTSLETRVARQLRPMD